LSVLSQLLLLDLLLAKLLLLLLLHVITEVTGQQICTDYV
jgi:hypothetical protein